MDLITSVINRVTTSFGLSLASATPETDSQSTQAVPSNYTPTTRSIIQTAHILSHRLPGDLIPPILDQANLWSTHTLCTITSPPQNPVAITNTTTSGVGRPTVYAGAVIPHNLPRGAVRVIRFRVVSKDQGWSSFPQWHGTYEGSWTWFEAGIVGLGNEGLIGREEGEGEGERYYSASAGVNGIGASACRPPGKYRYGGRRIVTNRHAHREWLEHVVEWRWDDEDSFMGDEDEDEDEDDGQDLDQNGNRSGSASDRISIGQMVRQVRGGCGLEVVACAQFPGWCNYVKSVSIEIDLPVVRRM